MAEMETDDLHVQLKADRRWGEPFYSKAKSLETRRRRMCGGELAYVECKLGH